MEIIITDDETIEVILNELYNIRNYDKGLNKLEFILIDNFKINLENNKIKIIYHETKQPHSRHILTEQIENLFDIFKILKNITLDKINPISWFSILWSGFKSTNQIFINTSFLTYYSFNNYQCVEEYTEIALIGILPIRFDSNIFLSNINNDNSLRF